MIYVACFVAGCLVACAASVVLYMRAKRHNESILTVIHGDLSGALQRIEEKAQRIESKIDGHSI